MNDWQWEDPTDLAQGLAPLDPARESMIEAMAAALQWAAEYGNAHGERILWMLPGGTFTSRHETDPAPAEAALEILHIGNLEDMLGEYWTEGLSELEGGGYELPETTAREWAAWWVGEYGQTAIAEAQEREARL